MWWLEILCLLVAIVFFFYRWVIANKDYFAKRGIPYDKPTFLMGSFVDIFRRQKSMYEVIIDLYNKHDGKVFGIFDQRQPLYLIRDPELLKLISCGDFEYFPNRRNAFVKDDTKESHIFGSSLFFLQNAKWKDMRNTLTPAFTGSKLRNTFALMIEVAQQTSDYLQKQIQAKSCPMSQQEINEESIELDLKDFAKRFTTDVIASTAFGLNVNSFINTENEFYTMGKKLTTFSFWQNIKFVLITNFGWISKLLKIDLFDKRFTNYFMDLVLKTMKYRKENVIVRPDMINLLMEAKGLLAQEKPKQGNRDWNDNEMVAQCLLFFIAGYETLSTLVSFTAYELMANPDVQEKLLREINEISFEIGDEPLSYEALQKMSYMDMVLSEVLRKWPGTMAIDRVCNKDVSYDLENGNTLNFKIGDTVWFPIVGLQMDPKYWTDPEKFIPERFAEENKRNIQPCTYLPFGMGPRNCIGSRFALMEAKAYLFYLVRDFRIEASPKMCNPFKLSTSVFELMPDGGFWFKLVRRHKIKTDDVLE
ncbi:putative cytochrome P450 9f2 [Haematobia irritans]|uniref:putative cytochrome P450 9f2 n=1 Tax=Haematobia irritans TaxID=7368 RepID=UPI003F502A7B